MNIFEILSNSHGSFKGNSKELKVNDVIPKWLKDVMDAVDILNLSSDQFNGFFRLQDGTEWIIRLVEPNDEEVLIYS